MTVVRAVASAIYLGIFSFVNLILAVTFNMARGELWYYLRDASNKTSVYSQVNPFLVNLEKVFWLLFILFAVAAIVQYVLGSHREEYETYTEPYERGEI